ncbi:cytochrome P450 4d2 isoform X2 [Leptinotarsa decemlineata]
MRIYFPPTKPAILIANPRDVRTLLSSGAATKKSKFYDYMKVWLGDGLVTRDEGETWRTRRKLLNPCFGRPSLLRHYTVQFEALGDILVEKLSEKLNDTSFDLLPFLKHFSMDVLSKTSLGVDLNCQKEPHNGYFESVDNMGKIVFERSISPLLKKYDFTFRFTKQYQTQTAAVDTINNFNRNIMRNKIRSYNSGSEKEPLPTFVDTLIHKMGTEGKVSEKDVLDEVNTFVFGGHGSTATGLAFTLYALAHHPECQEKILEEQRQIFGHLHNELTVTYDHLQEMKYLEKVINEALRMYPPFPFIGRKLVKDVELEGGIVLPKNLSVGIFVYGLHHNPKYFPEPKKFIPGRFDGNIVPFTFLPFAAGPRTCLGRKFSMIEMKSTISKLIRNFHLLPPGPTFQLELVPEMTLTSRNGIKISLEKRN